jgi:hypothetical protein
LDFLAWTTKIFEDSFDFLDCVTWTTDEEILLFPLNVSDLSDFMLPSSEDSLSLESLDLLMPRNDFVASITKKLEDCFNFLV